MSIDAPVTTITPMRPADLGFAVRLHQQSLPDGFFARLGPRFLRRYYATFVASPHAVALICGFEGRPVGALVGTRANRAHWSWVVRTHGVRLGLAGMLALLFRPREAVVFARTRTGRYVRAIWRLTRSATRPPRQSRGGLTGEAAPAPASVAVLTHICVSASARGSGAGRQLVRTFLDEAGRGPALEAQLITAARGGAADFYRHLGWEHVDDRLNHDGALVSRFRTPVATHR